MGDNNRVLLYFIPELRGVRPEDIDQAGLRYAFQSGTPWDQVHIAEGPGGSEGCVLRAGGRGRLGYFPDRQRWVVGPGAEWWVGIEGVASPEALERREIIDGHLVRLGDGNDWRIPVARSFIRGSALPHALVLGPDGEVVTEALPEYAALSAAVERIERAFLGQLGEGDPEEIDIKDGFRIAASALALNYRVGPAEVSFLRLLTTSNIRAVLEALVDVPTICEVAREMAGKAEAPADTGAGSSSSGGGGGS